MTVTSNQPLTALCWMSVSIFKSLMAVMPQSWSRRAAMALGRLILKHSSKARNRAVQNILRAYPELNNDDVLALAYKSYARICYGAFQILRLNSLRLEIHCDEQAKNMLQSEPGVCVATLHSACYEAVPLAVSLLSNKASTLSKIPPYLNFAKNIYIAAGIQCFNKNSNGSFIELLKAAKQGRNVVLHSDHFANDVPVRFFGEDTSAPAGIAMLSAMAKKPVLIGYACYDENFVCHVHLEVFSEQHCSQNTDAMQQLTQGMYGRFEQLIRQHKEDWYWSYNRWR
ncbi:lipid A biosynthesis acyltransferase [Paraneptunicella aestuarii]|uniref:lysophospholipid acyltransferase family protein n=1 Tax=Paraneptunicella aestuarii TaxID=2831148 RepID=UPI001E4BBA8E|nr:lipid A biosynthesis acyltransferase [Paraneptunicella aestuarii]UAA39267.1 lipid A biosynthesis acyltransferase [Paraneptunicella aestuarii]